MFSTFVQYHSEKVEVALYYVGELCDIMAYYEEQRKLVMISIIIAVFLKTYNTYCILYL